MDLQIKYFIKTTCFTIIFILFTTIGLWMVSRYIPMSFYHILFLLLLSLFAVAGGILLFIAIGFIYIYQYNTLLFITPSIVLAALRIIYPIMLYGARNLHISREELQGFFIKINNICIESTRIKVLPKDLLLLLPHCIQQAHCSIKITENLTLCKNCGKCSIGTLKEIHETYEIPISVVNGGTLARRMIQRSNPKLIIAIACERDLLNGILDIKNIPIIGVLNSRPHGPCRNTMVDMELVHSLLLNYLCSKEDL